MKLSTKNMVIGGGLAVFTLLFWTRSSKAVKEALKLFQQYGGILETHSQMRNFLYQLWRNVRYSDISAKKAIINKTAWSAAFISFLFREYKDFPKSASHSNYIVSSRINTQLNKGKFKLRQISDYRPKVGDIVCRNRNGNHYTYNSIFRGAESHCDIVVQVLPNKIITIGGNVSNTVKKTAVPTRNGFGSSLRQLSY